MFIHWTKLRPGRAWGSFMQNSSPSQGIVLLNKLSKSEESSSAKVKIRGESDLL
jgi:hypothetical protein